MYLLVVFVMLFSGLVVFCSVRKHLLLTLLSLEFLVMGLYLMFMYFMWMYEVSYYFVLFFMTFSVCEGALGLGVLVGIIRSHGSDYINSLSILGW